jgi:protein tyrosine/serine phosphatase
MRTNSTNFREIKSGKIAPNVLYRSNHPIYSGEQVKGIILRADRARIKTILNLSDSFLSLSSKVTYSPWYHKIFMKNNVIALEIPMCFDILEENFTQKIKQCVTFMIERNSPYLIHCEAGIDRTGFLAMILEFFMEAGFNDVIKDYMASFVYEDEFSKEDYEIAAPAIINYYSRIKGGLINDGDDIKDITVKYLTEKVGLNNKELTKLEYKLSKRDG